MAVETPITRSQEWFVGEDKAIDWTILQADEITPEDITDWTIEFIMTQRADEPPVVLLLIAELDTPASGTCHITIPRAYTASLPDGTNYYALRRTDEDANTILAYGDAELLPAPDGEWVASPASEGVIDGGAP